MQFQDWPLDGEWRQSKNSFLIIWNVNPNPKDKKIKRSSILGDMKDQKYK